MDTKGQKTSPIKRREIGMTGIVIVLSQLLTTLGTSKNISTDLKELREEIVQTRIDRERYFVRKEEFKIVAAKIDRLGSNVKQIKKEIKLMKVAKADADILGCGLHSTSSHHLEPMNLQSLLSQPKKVSHD